MFCSNCGSQIDDKSVVCPNCGVATNNYIANYPATSDKKNVLAIVGFILSFFIAIAGLICSIIGYKKAAELDGNGKGLALAGIIISTIWIAIVLFLVI